MSKPVRPPVPSKPKTRRSKKLLRRRDKRITWAIYGFCIAVLVTLAVVATVGSINSVLEKRELAATGIQTTATVTDLKVTVVSGRSTSYHYWLSYRFTPQGQADERNARLELPYDFWDTIQQGSSIAVTYKQSDPSVSEPTFMLTRLSTGTALVIGVIVVVILAPIYFWGIFTIIRWLLRPRKKTRKSKPRKARATTASTLLMIAGLLAVIGSIGTMFILIVVFVAPRVIDLLQNILL